MMDIKEIEKRVSSIEEQLQTQDTPTVYKSAEVRISRLTLTTDDTLPTFGDLFDSLP